MDRRDFIPILCVAIPLILVVGLIGGQIYIDANTPYKSVTYELYSCDAPDGHYYSGTEGNRWYFDTNLGNAYVMRYFDNNHELKTIIIDSTNENMHTFLFDNGTDTMHLKITYKYQYTNGTFDDRYTSYHLYVPDPKTM